MPHNILDTIVAHKRDEIQRRRERVPLEALQEMLSVPQSPVRNFRAALTGSNLAIIAEIKKASPSAGILKEDFDHVAIAKEYTRAKVDAISVLTDTRFFMGSCVYIQEVRAVAPVPVLRKDFILDTYQIYESRAYGADAVLLLSTLLSEAEVRTFRERAEALGMQALVECHTEAEIERALSSGATILGINNRDLKSFTIDIGTSIKLRPRIPTDHTVVSESGILEAADTHRIRAAGIDAILVGTSIMTATNMVAKIAELRAGTNGT